MPSRPAGRAAAAAAAATLVVLLAGCTGGGGTATRSSSSAAATRTPAAPATPTAGQQVAASGLADRMVAAVRDKRTATLAIRRQSGGTTSTGQGVLRLDASGTSAATSITTGGSTLRLRLLPGTLYLSTGQALAGKQWLKLSEKGTDPVSRLLAPLLSTLRSSTDLAQALGSYAKAGRLTVVGTEDVGGTSTTHYRGILPKAAVLETLPQQYRSALRTQVAGDSPFELWVDGQGLPVKLVQTSRLTSGESTTTVTYSHWGEPVTITAPPSADTATPGS